MTAQVWYLLGLVLLVLGVIDTAVFTYTNHLEYGVLTSIWGIAAMIMGLRVDLRS